MNSLIEAAYRQMGGRVKLRKLNEDYLLAHGWEEFRPNNWRCVGDTVRYGLPLHEAVMRQIDDEAASQQDAEGTR